MLHRYVFTLIFVVICAGTAGTQSVAQDEKSKPPAGRKSEEEQRERTTRMIGNQMLFTQLTFIAQNEELLKELEIVGDQVEQIETLAKEYQTAMQEKMSSSMKRQQEIQEFMKQGDQKKATELAQEFQNEWADMIDKRMKKLDEILLPHQLKRVKQISRQQSVKMQMKYNGYLGLPLSMAGDLGLNNEEKEKLREATEKADRELREELAKLTEKKMEAILKTLPKAKRDEYKELVGEVYDFDAALKRVRWSFEQKSPKSDPDKSETEKEN